MRYILAVLMMLVVSVSSAQELTPEQQREMDLLFGDKPNIIHVKPETEITRELKEEYFRVFKQGKQEDEFLRNYWGKIVEQKLILGDEHDFPEELSADKIHHRWKELQRQKMHYRALKFPLREGDFGIIKISKIKGLIYPATMQREEEIRYGEYVGHIGWADSNLTEKVILIDNERHRLRDCGVKFCAGLHCYKVGKQREVGPYKVNCLYITPLSMAQEEELFNEWENQND